MNERRAIGYLISIDTPHLGATSIYGTYEINSILEVGAKIKGYKITVSDVVDYKKTPYIVNIHLKKETNAS